MKAKVPPRERFIAITLGIALLLGSIAVIQYTESLFFVVIGWILVPVFAAKLWDRVKK